MLCFPLPDACAVCHMPALPASVVNCSGAGDCLVAGCLYGLAQGLPAEAALAHGIAASRAAVESQGNVPAGLSAKAVTAGAVQLQGRMTCLRLPVPAPCAKPCTCSC
jgi:sugar/nucleoside kinase (ribokinase family)